MIILIIQYNYGHGFDDIVIVLETTLNIEVELVIL